LCGEGVENKWIKLERSVPASHLLFCYPHFREQYPAGELCLGTQDRADAYHGRKHMMQWSPGKNKFPTSRKITQRDIDQHPSPFFLPHIVRKGSGKF
jgi:hypothetical protein